MKKIIVAFFFLLFGPVALSQSLKPNGIPDGNLLDQSSNPKASLSGSQQQQEPEFVIKAHARLVNVNVRILNKSKDPILGLTKEDFTVADDGVLQPITHFSEGKTPFNVVLVIDESGSMGPVMGKVQEAASMFIDSLGKDDQVAIIGFSQEAYALSQFTTDKSHLKDALSQLQAKGATSLYDTLYVALDTILKPMDGQKNAVVLLTDGGDNTSQKTLSSITTLLEKADSFVFPIGMGHDVDVDGLKALATSSGGDFYKISNVSGLKNIYDKIAKKLSNVYSLAFKPPPNPPPGKWRKIDVHVKAHEKAIVLARKYYCPGGNCNKQTIEMLAPQTLEEALLAHSGYSFNRVQALDSQIALKTKLTFGSYNNGSDQNLIVFQPNPSGHMTVVDAVTPMSTFCAVERPDSTKGMINVDTGPVKVVDANWGIINPFPDIPNYWASQIYFKLQTNSGIIAVSCNWYKQELGDSSYSEFINLISYFFNIRS